MKQAQRFMVSPASKFVLLCGIMALFYLIYRLGLLSVSVTSLDNGVFHTQAASVVCSSEGDDQTPDPTRLFSASYQDKIRKQPAISPNLVANADLMKNDVEAIVPNGFTRNDGDPSAYQFLEDADKTRFLRVVDKRESLPAGDGPLAWLPPLSVVQPERTYAYSFWYRSGVPISIVLESSYAQGFGYQEITTLPATSTWRQFSGHYGNLDGAKSFRPIIRTTKAGYVDVKGFDIHQIADASLAEGMISVTFDDGWESVSNALPLLKQYDIRTTQYIISEVADSNIPEYMSFSSIEQLKKNGHEIGSHSLRHCNQTKLDPAVLQENATKSKQLLEDKGLGPIRSFAYPLGQYNDLTQAVYERRFTYIRTSDAGYNDRYFDTANVYSMGVVDKTSDEQFKSWLDYARAHRLWLVLVYHRVDEKGQYNVSSAQLERQLLMIKESKLKVLPLAEAADTVRQ